MTTPKRPRDPNQLAKFIVDVATGETEDRPAAEDTSGKSPDAVALGRKGGQARASRLSAEERARISRLAASKRWAAKSD